MSGVISAIRLVSPDPEGLADFYARAFGFARDAGRPAPSDPYGGPVRRFARLALGEQRIEIVALDGDGAPETPAAPDTRFQHFAMVAPLMDAAIRRLDGVSGWTPISRGGPQALPESSGGVVAFKLRDPDGHPLELLSFPPDATPEPWRGDAGGDVLGIDHTAIVVQDTAASVAFYATLAFTRIGGSLNRGPEQARLDGVPDPVVEVTALALPGAPPPHLELLCYREPPTVRRPAGPCDVAATRTVLARPGSDGEGSLVDPDGHRWILAAPA